MNAKKMNVLVTGATGAVGPRVVWALHAANYHIRTLSLDMAPASTIPDGVEVRVGDVTDEATVQSATKGMDVVMHLAALVHSPNPEPKLHDPYEHANVVGTAAVVGAAAKAGVKRILFFSTITVYGGSEGTLLDENSPTHPGTLYARTKLEAEQIVLNARGSDGRPIGTVLRLAAVYGSRVKGNYERLVRGLAHKFFIPVGDGQNRRTLIYDRDVAQAAVLAAEHPDAAGRIYNVTDGSFHTLKEIIAAICTALGRKPPRFSVPSALAFIMAGTLESAARLVGRGSPITRATIDKYVEDIAVESRRIEKELGFVPNYDLRAGWDETIREMRANGTL